MKEFPNILIHTAKDNKIVGVDHKEAIIIKKDNNDTTDNNTSNSNDKSNNKNTPSENRRFKVKVTLNHKNDNFKINNKN